MITELHIMKTIFIYMLTHLSKQNAIDKSILDLITLDIKY